MCKHDLGIFFLVSQQYLRHVTQGEASDGRLLLQATRDYGAASATGYELDADLVAAAAPALDDAAAPRPWARASRARRWALLWRAAGLSSIHFP